MDPTTPIVRGCLVHLPHAKEGDVVVCMDPDTWIQFSSETKELLSPFGTIDIIGGGRFRRGNVIWREKPSFFQAYHNEIVAGAFFLGLIFLLIFVAHIVALWDKEKSAELSNAAGVLMIMFLVAVISIMFLRIEEENNRKQQAFRGNRTAHWRDRRGVRYLSAPCSGTDTDEDRSNAGFLQSLFDPAAPWRTSERYL